MMRTTLSLFLVALAAMGAQADCMEEVSPCLDKCTSKDKAELIKCACSCFSSQDCPQKDAEALLGKGSCDATFQKAAEAAADAVKAASGDASSVTFSAAAAVAAATAWQLL